MSAVSTVQSTSSIYSSIAALTRNKPSGATASAADTGSKVSISAAAREAAKNDAAVRPGLKLPDYVTQWFTKDFPQDVIVEAKARLADIKTNGELGAHGPLNLPLLPENQALRDSFRAEMKSIQSAGFEHPTPEQAARYNLLLNLNMRLQLTGWQRPMTEADVQREFDVAAAMAKLAGNGPVPAGDAAADPSPEQIVAETQAHAVPSVWQQRWAKAGLEMPTDLTLSPQRPLWLELAQAAGIGDEEFVAKARSLAQEFKGNALTAAVETFISERYVALQATMAHASAQV